MAERQLQPVDIFETNSYNTCMTRKNVRDTICGECQIAFSARVSEILRGNGKFCTRTCANRYNNRGRKMSEETKEKMKNSLRAYYKNNPKATRQAFLNGQKSQRGKNKPPKTILDMAKRTTGKILRRLKIPCSYCGWNKGVCDIHHIIPKREGGTDEHDNLSYLCPNCHRLAGNGEIKREKLITFEKYLQDDWREKYYG